MQIQIKNLLHIFLFNNQNIFLISQKILYIII